VFKGTTQGESIGAQRAGQESGLFCETLILRADGAALRLIGFRVRRGPDAAASANQKMAERRRPGESQRQRGQERNADSHRQRTEKHAVTPVIAISEGGRLWG